MSKNLGGIDAPANESQGGTGSATFAGARTNLGVAATVSPKTLAYTAVAADRGNVIYYTGAGGVTLTLDPAATLGNGWSTTLRNDSTGNITIDPTGGETINGAATLVVTPSQSLDIFCNGALFFTMGTSAGAASVGYNSLDAALSYTAFNVYIGTSLEDITVSAVSDGVTILLTAQKSGGGDFTLVFSGGPVVVDATPALTIALTPGTNTVPVLNYIYILKSAPTILTVSTVGFPAGVEFYPVAQYLCQTAASFQTFGPYKSVINDSHLWKDTTQLGEAAAVGLWILAQRPIFISGSAITPLLTPGAPDTLTFSMTSGNFLKLRRILTPAFNSATPGSTNLTTFFVTNVLAAAFSAGKDLYNFRATSGGLAAANNDRISWVIWASLSENAADYTVYVNLPSGFYTTDAAAIADDSLFSNYNIPEDFRNTGFLIAKLVYNYQTAGGGDLTLVQNLDLRGTFPSSSAGGSSVAGANTQLSNLSGVTVNASLPPSTNNLFDLGSPAFRWRDIYVDGQLRSGQTIGDTYQLTARDVDTAVDVPFMTLTAANIPTCNLSGEITSVTQAPLTNNTTLATTAYSDALRPVSIGGTGVASNTAFSVLCGGTVGANPIQSVASVGTAGQILTSNGPGALPSFQPAAGGGGSLVYLAGATPSGAANASFDNIFTATYDNYLFVYNNVSPGTNSVGLTFRVGTTAAPTYQATNYSNALNTTTLNNTETAVTEFSGSRVATAHTLTGVATGDTATAITSVANFVLGGELLITNTQSATSYKNVVAKTSWATPNGSGARPPAIGSFGGFWNNATTPLTSGQFLMTVGNISGQIRLYGIKNS